MTTYNIYKLYSTANPDTYYIGSSKLPLNKRFK